MKLIKISTDMELTVHDFPEGSLQQQNKVLQELIGNGCSIYQHVMPNRLYKVFGVKDRPTEIPGQCVSMLVDEESLLKVNEPNMVGSYFYESDKHGHPIMGNILLVGEQLTNDGIDFCGIEDSVFNELEMQLKNTIKLVKEARGK